MHQCFDSSRSLVQQGAKAFARPSHSAAHQLPLCCRLCSSAEHCGLWSAVRPQASGS